MVAVVLPVIETMLVVFVSSSYPVSQALALVYSRVQLKTIRSLKTKR